VSYELSSALFSASLFAGVLLALVIGRAVGTRRMRQDAEGARAGVGALEGAVFGLMGLLIAFTFSGAASRFDARRELIVDETNAIGTAWLRLASLQADDQPAIRDTFRAYVDARLAIYRDFGEPAAAQARVDSLRLADELWAQAVSAVQRGGLPQAPMLLMPALNEMFDIATTRTMALEMHPPPVVFAMLFGLTLIASLLAGAAMAGGKWPSWLHMVGFALVMGISAYVILDLEFPRQGLIRVDAFDHVLTELRDSMK
jgi:hypothetical protein